MSKVGERIKEVILKECESFGLFLVGEKFAPGGILLQFFMDSEGPLDMKEMTRFARHINKLTEEMDLGQRKFNLEIGSPGASKPFSDLRQLPKHIGKELKVLLGEEEIIGEFKSLEGEKLELEKKIYKSPNSKKFTTETVFVNWSEAKEIKVKLKY